MLPGTARGLARAPAPALAVLLGLVSCRGWLPPWCHPWGGDGWGWAGMDGNGYPGGIVGSCLFSPLPRFSPMQKEKKNTQ